MKFDRRGVMLVIASPSGAGKSSTTKRLLAQDDNLTLSVSVTTRPRRSSETDGVDYHFISVEKFEQMRVRGDLLESAEVHGNFYGTPAAKVDEQIENGRDVVFDIDYQGTQQLYEKRRVDMVSVFLLPPSISELHQRLRARASDSDESIARRLRTARIEIGHWAEYDYVLVNENLEDTASKVAEILDTARNARTRQTNLSHFINELQRQLDSI